MTAVRRQFIAGARCPRCNALDKIRLCRDAQREWIECVACGHVAEEPDAPDHPSPPAAPATGIVRLKERK